MNLKDLEETLAEKKSQWEDGIYGSCNNSTTKLIASTKAANELLDGLAFTDVGGLIVELCRLAMFGMDDRT